MVEKCLNPACAAKFRTLRDGRVFVKEVDDDSHENGGTILIKSAIFGCVAPAVAR